MVEANELRPDDALMPLYRDLVRGYEVVYQPISGHMYATHRLADEWNVRHEIYEGNSGNALAIISTSTDAMTGRQT